VSAIETSVTLRWAITKRCPFRDELDAGDLEITVAEDAPELHNLAAEIWKLAAEIWKLTAEPVTHEAFTRAVAMMLPPGSEVVTTWNTGPFSVTVTSRVIASGEVATS
jgi:hypothetical protein